MIHRGGTVLAALTVSAMMVTMAGCSADDEDEPISDDVTSSSTEPTDTSMADALRRSKRAFLDSVVGLRAAGYLPAFGYTRYAICTDEGADWRVSANGRLDREPPIPSTRADAEAIRDELTSVGWTASDTPTSPEGIRESSSHWIVTVERDDLTFNASLYADQPFVLIRVLGPCLPATPEQQEEYEAAPDQRFPVPRGTENA
jgi:hypothetical protein